MRNALVCAAVALALAANAGAAEKRPHLVLFLSDDHGQEFAGCYGNPVIQTPHLDALAKQGRRFTNVFAASPTCSPSRAALYTGLYPPRNGLIWLSSAAASVIEKVRPSSIHCIR